MKKAWDKSSSSFKARIIGKLLGDGSITQQKGRKPRFQFIHMESDYDWSHFCYEQLKDHIPLNPPKFKKIMDHRLRDGYSTCYYVQSKTAPVITLLRNIWYPSGKKIIPWSFLEDFFTAESLAWWYMDDGHLKVKCHIPKKIILSTESFSDSENNQLITFLQCKFKLTFSRDGQNRIILYDQFQIYTFLDLINQYIHPCLYRKQVRQSSTLHPIAAKRTTLYLPKTILIHKPTYDINTVLLNLKQLIGHHKTGVFYKLHSPMIHSTPDTKQNSYQIVINSKNMSNLVFLNRNTGLSFTKLTWLCFQIAQQKTPVL